MSEEKKEIETEMHVPNSIRKFVLFSTDYRLMNIFLSFMQTFFDSVPNNCALFQRQLLGVWFSFACLTFKICKHLVSFVIDLMGVELQLCKHQAL